MAATKIEKIYQQHVKPLLPAERLSLLKLITDDLVAQPAESAEGPKRSIMELHGLGKEIWGRIDPQEYVDGLRKEWDHLT